MLLFFVFDERDHWPLHLAVHVLGVRQVKLHHHQFPTFAFFLLAVLNVTMLLVLATMAVVIFTKP